MHLHRDASFLFFDFSPLFLNLSCYFSITLHLLSFFLPSFNNLTYSLSICLSLRLLFTEFMFQFLISTFPSFGGLSFVSHWQALSAFAFHFPCSLLCFFVMNHFSFRFILPDFTFQEFIYKFTWTMHFNSK